MNSGEIANWTTRLAEGEVVAVDEACEEGAGLQHCFGHGCLIGATTAQADAVQARQATELAAQAPGSAFVLCGREQYAGLVDVWFAQGGEHAACGEDNGEEDDDPLTAPEGGEELAEVYFIVWVVLGVWGLRCFSS